MGIKALRNKLATLDTEERTLRTEAANLIEAAEKNDGGKPTAEQDTRLDAIRGRLEAMKNDRDAVNFAIANAERMADLERLQSGAPSAVTSGVREAWLDDPKRGYRTAASLIVDIHNATLTGRVSPQLASLDDSRPMATAGSDEQSTQSDPYGGFFIPTGLLGGVKTVSPDADPLNGLTTQVDMTGVRTLKVNARVDKDHSTSVSGGLVVYRRVETQTVTPKRMQFEQVELQKNEQMGVTYATEELLAQSAVAFASILGEGFRDEFAAKTFEERLNGNGVGMYQGIANSPALVTISKETGQAADTIVFENVVKMIARCWGYGSAVWLANPTCYPQLRMMTQPGSTIPIFATGTPGIATLEGRPIYFNERCAALGDLGDLILVNPSEYLESQEGGIQQADSMHVRFLEHERTFKFWTTNAGAGWWRTALTPKRGDTRSPFIYLAAR